MLDFFYRSNEEKFPRKISAAQQRHPRRVQGSEVLVKYRGDVDLKPFVGESYTNSSLVRRICYDTRESYPLVSLNGNYSR